MMTSMGALAWAMSLSVVYDSMECCNDLINGAQLRSVISTA